MTGYGEFAFEYQNKGWSPLPLPHAMKKTPPSGYTGYRAVKPSGADIAEWMEQFPNGNICLHFPDGLVGIDVDAYGDRTGQATFEEALRRWGPLPDTVMTTSRPDGVSGIRVYRIPQGTHLHNQIHFPELGVSNIEIIQASHRYAVVFPSEHPETGLTYQWIDHTGAILDEIPRVADLPELPSAWLEGLRKEQVTAGISVDASEAVAALPEGEMSLPVKMQLEKSIQAVKEADGSRHDTTMVEVGRLLRLGEKNEPGVKEALLALGRVFVECVADRSTEFEAKLEYGRMFANSRIHDLIASSPSVEGLSGLRSDAQYVHTEPPYTSATIENNQVNYTYDDEPFDEVSDFLYGSDDGVAIAQEALGAQPVGEVEGFLFDVEPGLVNRVNQMMGNPSGTTMREKLLTIDGLANLRPTRPIIDGLIYENTLAQIAGPPGSFKSFVTLAMACAIASGKNSWLGNEIERNGPVIYVAAEGVSGLRPRILAWCEQNGVEPDTLQLYVYPEAIQLGLNDHVVEISQLARDLDAVMVVLDTRARCAVGVEENSATEQGDIIRRADAIRESTACTVLCVHHGSRGNGAAPRGSNAWDGAVWTDLRVQPEETENMKIVIHVEKHKDAESGHNIEFAMNPWTVDESRMPGVEEKYRQTLIVDQRERLEPTVRTNPEDMRRIVELLIDGSRPTDGMTRSSIKQGLDLTDAAVRKACYALLSANKITRVGGTDESPKYTAVAEREE